MSPVASVRPPASHAVRVEYVSFANVGDHREYCFVVHAGDRLTRQVVRVSLSLFGAARLRLQDGPDVCYQGLLRALEAGHEVGSGVITLAETDVTDYRDAHTPAPRRRAPPRTTPVKRPESQFRPAPRERAPLLPVAPAAVSPVALAPAFHDGQRVSHPVYGAGVTSASTDGRTCIRFDVGGPRTFLTALLEVEVLSEPGAWETTARGKNRPREGVAAR